MEPATRPARLAFALLALLSQIHVVPVHPRLLLLPDHPRQLLHRFHPHLRLPAALASLKMHESRDLVSQSAFGTFAVVHVFVSEPMWEVSGEESAADQHEDNDGQTDEQGVDEETRIDPEGDERDEDIVVW